MVRLLRNLLRAASKSLNQFCKLCWLVPSDVSDDERILRAIYSPHHLDKNRLRQCAYDPTPSTDEISVMRLEYMGPHACKRKARSFNNPKHKKEYRGFAVLGVSAVRASEMMVVDSRKYYCGHADIRLMIQELRSREGGEPLSAEAGKRFKDLKKYLLSASNYIPDPVPQSSRWKDGKLDPP